MDELQILAVGVGDRRQTSRISPKDHHVCAHVCDRASCQAKVRPEFSLLKVFMHSVRLESCLSSLYLVAFGLPAESQGLYLTCVGRSTTYNPRPSNEACTSFPAPLHTEKQRLWVGLTFHQLGHHQGCCSSTLAQQEKDSC